ncbi:hypothetical protein Nepgr_007383 [Nepenthes gracilis]|uniref:VQ domain-containing protein n=1 Tax=Nepenthes gracilis TaxID=150966 RepID=A0AAD3S6X3_NEPGR|nr:hypothetical protein Nepgr_007383 [Nepenthes gracilis]
MGSGSRSALAAAPMKVVYINTQYVETDAVSFKSVVQRLTGKNAAVGADSPKQFVQGSGGYGKEQLAREIAASGEEFPRGNSLLMRDFSCKEIERLFELPLLEERQWRFTD